MKKNLFLLLIIWSYVKQTSAQNFSFSDRPNHTIDSLQIFLKTANEDTNKVIALYDLSDEYTNTSNYEKAKGYVKDALLLSQKLHYIKGQATGYFEIGLIYDYQGNYPDALKNYFTSLRIFEAAKDNNSIASCYNNIGGIYSKKNNYKDALKTHLAALTIRKEMKDRQGMADSYNNIAGIYYLQKKHDLALTNFIFALNINKELGDKYGMIECYNNIGANFKELKYYGSSLNYYFDALKISKNINDKFGIAATFGNIGETYILIKRYKEATFYLDSALATSKEIGSNELIKDHFEYYTKLDSTTDNWKDAYEHHKQFILYRDKLINEENTKNAMQAQMQYEYGKKEATTKAEQDKKDALAKEELKIQTFERNGFILGFALMIILAGVSYGSFRRKRKDNEIISQQKNLVEQKNVIVEQKNKEITQSIEYAKRIQNAILPSEKFIVQHLTNSFIIYKPKDIIAGDFYWMEVSISPKGGGNQTQPNITSELQATSTPFLGGRDGLLLFAACDCTGHGVPGAMVSVVCHNALNRAVREFGLTQPAAILNKVGEIVIESFAKSENDIKDGMDVSLCAYNPKTNELQWAGANNPLWIVSNDKLIEIKPDKQPIGKYDFAHPFTNHVIQIQSGDMIYLFSDGFADQFGGTKAKKFKFKKLQETLLTINHKSMADQKQLLEKTFNDWKGDLEQTDDVLFIGVRM